MKLVSGKGAMSTPVKIDKIQADKTIREACLGGVE